MSSSRFVGRYALECWQSFAPAFETVETEFQYRVSLALSFAPPALTLASYLPQQVLDKSIAY